MSGWTHPDERLLDRLVHPEGCPCRACAGAARQRFGYPPFTDAEWRIEGATQFRNREDRQVITAHPCDGTGTTDQGSLVSRENMRLVKYGPFWEPIAWNPGPLVTEGDDADVRGHAESVEKGSSSAPGGSS